MNLYNNIRSKVYIPVLLILLCLFAVSCTDESNVSRPDSNTDANIKITIYTPGTTLPKNLQKSTESSEHDISKIKILVFKQNSTGYEYQYSVDGEQIMSVGNNTTTFTAKLISSDSPLKLILVANSQNAFDNYWPQNGAAEATVRENLIESFDGDLSNGIPMYGETTLSSLNAEQSNNITLTMLRSIARVDVNNNVSEHISEKFKLDKVYIYRANDKGTIIPASANMNTGVGISVKSASVPSSATFLADADAYNKVAETGATSITQLYVTESLPVTNESSQLKGATCVVVGGYYGNDSSPSYYRIDFNSGVEGHPFGQILRNHKYIFNVQSVHSRGWPTPDEAANNESTSISVTMQVWNEMTSEMYFSDDDNYLGISQRKVTLNYSKGSQQTVYLQSTVPFQIQAVGSNGNLTGSPISSVGQSFENEFFKLQIVKDASDAEDICRLVITALQDNLTEEELTGYFKVFTDAWTFEVEVEQESYIKVYNNRIIRVLTITSSTDNTTAGNLGTTDRTFMDNSGVAMRNVLENRANFSPTGTVPVGGIIVINIDNNSLRSMTDPLLEMMLATVDVVHLPRGCALNVLAAEDVYEWLMESKHRVLILGTDTQTTNGTLQRYFDGSKAGYIDDGDWMYSKNITGLYAEQDDDRGDPFFKGKFGSVTSGNRMGFIDAGCGYNDGYNYNSTTVLLRVTNDSPDGAGRMTHGVNKDLGVFYWGESRVTTATGEAMSQNAHNNGTVSSEFDILMANSWAWIVDRVITGDTSR